MKQASGPLAPDLPESLLMRDALTDDLLALVHDRDDIEGIRFSGVSFASLKAKHVSFRGCAFDRCRFGETDVPTVQFDMLDCAFSSCDFAGARFDRSAFRRVSFARCRIVGAYFTQAGLRDAAFDDCQMTYANFGMAKLTNVWMNACDLSFSSFGYAQFTNVRWDACRLSAAELFGTRLRGMDLRACEIDGIVVGDRTELEGAIVTPTQACELAKLLGLVIV